MYAIILADDVGEKLWPVTNEEFPKALFPIYSNNTLLEETLLRVIPFVETGKKVFIVVLDKSFNTLKKQGTLDSFDIPERNVIRLPDSRGTVWSILAACKKIAKKNKDETVVITPADQFFWPLEPSLMHMHNLLDGVENDPTSLFGLCLPPAGPSPLLNYVRGDWETNQIIGIPLEDPIEGTLNTLAVQIKEHSCRPDRELAQTLSVADWLWDLNTYAAPARLIEESITSDKQFAKWAKKDILKVCWNELPSASFEDYIVPNLITANKFRAAVIPRIAWSVLDNWVAIHRLLYESGLFVIQPVEGIHQIDSQDNLVFKPTDKEVALYGVSDLIVIDTGDRLLIGTPEGLHENF